MIPRVINLPKGYRTPVKSLVGGRHKPSAQKLSSQRLYNVYFVILTYKVEVRRDPTHAGIEGKILITARSNQLLFV